MRAPRDRRRNVRTDLLSIVAPEDVRLRDIAFAVGLDPEHMILRESARDEEDALRIDHARDEVAGRAVDDPHLLAGPRIVRCHATTAAQDELRSPARLEDDGRDVRAFAIGAVGPPALLPRRLIERDDVRLGVLVSVEDDEVLV